MWPNNNSVPHESISARMHPAFQIESSFPITRALVKKHLNKAVEPPIIIYHPVSNTPLLPLFDTVGDPLSVTARRCAAHVFCSVLWWLGGRPSALNEERRSVVEQALSLIQQ